MTTPPPSKALRVLVALLIVNLALSIVFAALTLVFRQDVLAYQLSRHPGADVHALARTLWTRPIPVLVVGVLYIRVVQQLLSGVRGAHRRVQIVSMVGFLAVGWLLISGAYPGWLRIVEGVQLGLLAALVVTVNRPAVRSLFTADPNPDTRPRNLRAALLLAVVAPVVAEVSLGTVPLHEAWVMPIYVPIYGAGVLLIRELVRRLGGGTVNLLLMGAAYGLVEEGLALQSLTSPHLYGAAGWAPRLLGLNTAYAELNLVYHAVFSVTIPVLLVELVFPRHGAAPYLRRGGVVLCGVVAALGAGLLRVTVPLSQDPGYVMPLAAALTVAALAALTTVVALRVRVRPPSPLTPPTPRTVGVACGSAAFAFLALVWPFAGAHQPLFTHGAWALLPMTGAAVVVAALTALLRRWSASPAWGVGHLTAALTGGLVGHSLFGLVGNADRFDDRLFLALVTALTLALGWAVYRRAAAPGSYVEAPSSGHPSSDRSADQSGHARG